MNRCEVNAMADENTTDDCVPHGKVGEVCKQWLVKEDGVLAYKLQNQEIEQHYEGNRWKSKVERLDFHQAKHLQTEEERILEEQQRLFEQQMIDERIAKEIQDELLSEERRMQTLKDEDERLARKMYEKEKEKLHKRRLQKEKQQLEKIKVEKGLITSIDELNVNDTQQCSSIRNRDDYLSDIDLSEFCMKPPPGLSEEELKQFLAEQDAEIALFLQQQEAKRNDAVAKERKMIVEAQDFEIARLLQMEEKARAKRLREKARQRNLQKMRNSGSASSELIETSVDDESRIDTPISETNSTQSSNPNTLERTHSEDPSARALPPLPCYHNIAIDLDPTYNKGVKHNNNNNHDLNSNCSGLYYAQVYQVSPGSTSSESPTSTLQTQGVDMSGGQYLPVQGHRRNTNERPKSKKQKDGCKTH